MVETIRTPVFNRYEVLERIGSGGMGTVYKARDRHLDRLVALKILTPGLQAHAESLERFRREARALAQLKHPSVAAVYDANVEGGFPYLVMEFVEGDTLEQVLHERGPLPVAEVVRLGFQLAEALDHIHRHHIVHRDVKTSNIILGADGRAVLADFGIALVASLPRISHGALGTPEYMSPEQADGKPLDGRTDVYSLGIVLYECLAGTVPFQREGESLADLTGLMKQILEDVAPPLRRRRADVPVWLAAVVERCLAKAPAARYERSTDVAEALRHETSRAAGSSDAPDEEAEEEETDASAAAGSRYGRSYIAESDAPQRRPGLSVISHTQPVVALGVSPDSRYLATASADRTVRLWEVATGRLLHTLDRHDGNVSSVAFSPEGRYLASGDVGGTVRLWEARTGRLVQRLEGHTALALAVAFSRDGGRLASGGADGTVRLWEVRRGRALRVLGGHTGYVLSVAFSPDGRRLASSGADGTIRLWDPAAGRRIQLMNDHGAWVISVAFSPDGRLLASGGADGTVRIWEAATGLCLRTLRGHRAWVMAVAFSPDGASLVSACRDQAVRVFDVESGRLVHQFEHHADAVMAAAYSPNGKYLVSGSKDHTVRLWPAQARKTARRSPLRRFFGLLAVCMVLAAVGLQGHASGPGAWDAAVAPPEALFGPDDVGGYAGWTMVVASPVERNQAEHLATRWRRRGYRAGVVPVFKDGAVHYRVGVGHFRQRDQALAVLHHLAGRTLPPDAWVVQVEE